VVSKITTSSLVGSGAAGLSVGSVMSGLFGLS
jgi:hypothetical protein